MYIQGAAYRVVVLVVAVCFVLSLCATMVLSTEGDAGF